MLAMTATDVEGPDDHVASSETLKKRQAKGNVIVPVLEERIQNGSVGI
jgi:hypothetical protein